MKLLSLEIGKMEQNFRSLHPGFAIRFHSIDNRESMENFRPFCFAGLNGSGKSNVLEALANIFYHLEICVARYLPDSIRHNQENFQRNKCTPDAFILEYLIGQLGTTSYNLNNFHKVTIRKEASKEPEMIIQEFPFNESVPETPISLNPDLASDKPAPGKRYLPDQVIGYSSGENEILSLPFIKSRIVHLDEFKQATKVGEVSYNEPENSLIYIDNNMSQAVLLACLIFESNESLKSIRDEQNGVGIIALRSFRMCINLHNFKFHDVQSKVEFEKPISTIMEFNQIEKLKKCATSWYANEKTLWLDFFVNDATKTAFQQNFSTSFELFQVFRLLYELNGHFIEDRIKDDVYRSRGFYTDGKLPVGSPEDDVFHFLDFKILKKIKETGEVKELLLREFSDGEHQFLHTIGICLLLKDKRSLLLLDEPETHFNPSWRAKFIKIVNESISESSKADKYSNQNFNIHYLKDIIITSHSPFIISDCLPNNVILFEKNKKNKQLEAKNAAELGINTFGAGVDVILEKLFKFDQSIGDNSKAELEKIDYDQIKTAQDVIIAKKVIDHLSESIEKDLVLAKLNQIARNITNRVNK